MEKETDTDKTNESAQGKAVMSAEIAEILDPLIAKIQTAYPDHNASGDDACPVCMGPVSWRWHAQTGELTISCHTYDCVSYSSEEVQT